MAALAFLLASGASQADHNEAEIGVLRVMPLSTSTPLATQVEPSLAGTALGLRDFDSPGTSFRPGNAVTIVTTFVHVFGEHFAVKFEGGIPPKFKLYGRGVVSAPGASGALFNVDLGAPQNQPLATARQWSPTVLFQYRARAPTAFLQPYLGLGISYNFYTGLKLGQGIESDLNTQFGAPLALAALKPGPTTAKPHATASVVPVLNGGAALRLSPKVALVGSVSYALVSTDARIDLRAADGTLLAQSRTNLVLNPLIVGLLLNYRF